jgi:hypothetical protein
MNKRMNKTVYHQSGPLCLLRNQVLTVVNMKMPVLQDVAPCSLVEVHRRFRDAC